MTHSARREILKRRVEETLCVVSLLSDRHSIFCDTAWLFTEHAGTLYRVHPDFRHPNPCSRMGVRRCHKYGQSRETSF